jgi:threonine dehydrogenase-like Zn-dependent dehydrogenase
MRALAVFPSTKTVKVVETPDPSGPLQPKQVLLRTLEVGICGTDREIARFEYGKPPPGKDRLVLGHESMARVESVGSAVRRLKPGMLAIPTVRRPCDDPTCGACRAGIPDFCITGAFRERGIKEADGFLTELFVEDEGNLIHLPDSLSEVGVLVEPLSIAAKAAPQIEAIQERMPWHERDPHRALVLGAGAVGLLGAMMLASNDFDVYVYSREPSDGERAQLVRSLGGTYVSALETELPALRSRIGGMDVVFEAVGHSPVAFEATAALGPNGVFVFTGVPALGPNRSVDLDRIMRDLVLGNQVYLGTVNAGHRAYRTAVHELEQFMTLFPDALTKLIAHRAPIEEAPQLLEGHVGIKDVVRMAPVAA